MDDTNIVTDSSSMPQSATGELSSYLEPPRYEISTLIGGILGALISGILGAILAFVTFGFFISSIGNGDTTGILLAFIPLLGFLIACVTLSINRLIARGLLGLTHTGGGNGGTKYIFLSGAFVTIASIPLYVIIALSETIPVPLIFALHIILQVFVSELVMSIISNYRYVLLSLGSSVFGLMLSLGMITLVYRINFSDGNAQLYGLIGAIVTAMIGTYTGKYFLEYIYSFLYRITGNDPLSRVIDDMRESEDSLRQESERRLNTFS